MKRRKQAKRQINSDGGSPKPSERRRILNLLLDIEEEGQPVDLSGELLQQLIEAIKENYADERLGRVDLSLKQKIEELRNKLKLSPQFFQQMRMRITKDVMVGATAQQQPRDKGGRPRHNPKLVALVVAQKKAGRKVKDIIKEVESKFHKELTVDACQGILRRSKLA